MDGTIDRRSKDMTEKYTGTRAGTVLKISGIIILVATIVSLIGGSLK